MRCIISYLVLIIIVTGCYPRKKLMHGFTCEYYYLSTNKKRVVFGVKSIDSIPNKNNYYAITGSVLKDKLKSCDKSIVYLWDPRCGGEFCYSLKWIEEFAIKKERELFVIPLFIDLEIMDLNNGIKNNLIPIDFKYYNTIFCKSYVTSFFQDLVGEEKENVRQKPGRYYWFEKDVLVNKTVDLK